MEFMIDVIVYHNGKGVVVHPVTPEATAVLRRRLRHGYYNGTVHTVATDYAWEAFGLFDALGLRVHLEPVSDAAFMLGSEVFMRDTSVTGAVCVCV